MARTMFKDLPPVVVPCKVVAFTDKAVRIVTDDNRRIWIPLGHCLDNVDDETTSLRITAWIADQKGL